MDGNSSLQLLTLGIVFRAPEDHLVSGGASLYNMKSIIISRLLRSLDYKLPLATMICL